MSGLKPYSRVSQDSLTDEQLARLIPLVDLAERDQTNREARYLGVKDEDARLVAQQHRADALALRELHALLVHERQERLIDVHDARHE